MNCLFTPSWKPNHPCVLQDTPASPHRCGGNIILDKSRSTCSPRVRAWPSRVGVCKAVIPWWNWINISASDKQKMNCNVGLEPLIIYDRAWIQDVTVRHGTERPRLYIYISSGLTSIYVNVEDNRWTPGVVLCRLMDCMVLNVFNVDGKA